MPTPLSTLSSELRERIENTIRFLAVDAVQKANSGHPGAPMGLARAAFELWDAHLRFDPQDPHWPLRDRFVLSNGHASMLQYALLHLFGFDVSLDDLRNFRQLHSKTPGHPEYGDTPGIELTTGPLGQGFGHGVGMALAGRLARSRFGVDGEGPGYHTVYGIVSDGDVMEGISHEAASLAGHLGLGNLIYLYDDNHITIDGPTTLSLSDDVGKRFEAYGWHVDAVDGMDHEGLRRALESARAEEERPSLVVTRTTIGWGSPNKAGTSATHGSPLGEEEVLATKKALGWPLEPTFLVPDEVRGYLAQRTKAKREDRIRSDERLDLWRRAHPERAAAWDAARGRELPDDLGALLREGMEGVADATRKHSGKVLERLAEHVPYMVGGSADLAGSAAPPMLKKGGVIGPAAGDGKDPFAGSNIHFGVREHAMAAITNGIALDATFQPYCGTFLIFSDYLRPSLRLAALMKLRSIFVFTHDSIFLGEDGPTHQPIEHLDALRAIPRLRVFRPADGVETAMAYAWILEHADGPSAFALTRQKVPAIERRAPFAPEDVWKGAYPLNEVERPDVVVIATGSEVPLSQAAADRLASNGVRARVVSAPCLELFYEQPESYRLALVPDDGTPLVGVEAARGESLRRLVGRQDLVYGIDRFGASAPYQDLEREYGFTPDQLAEAIRKHLG
jgi:transketolase